MTTKLSLDRPPPCLYPSPLPSSRPVVSSSSSSDAAGGGVGVSSSLSRFKSLQQSSSRRPPNRHPSENFELSAIRSAFSPNSFTTLRDDLPNVLKPGNVHKLYVSRAGGLAGGSGSSAVVARCPVPSRRVWSQRMCLFSHVEHLPNSYPQVEGGKAPESEPALTPFIPAGSSRRLKHETMIQGGEGTGTDEEEPVDLQQSSPRQSAARSSAARPREQQAPPPVSRRPLNKEVLVPFNSSSVARLPADATSLDARLVATVLYKTVAASWPDADFRLEAGRRRTTSTHNDDDEDGDVDDDGEDDGEMGRADANGNGTSGTLLRKNKAGVAARKQNQGRSLVLDVVFDLDTIRGEEEALIMFMEVLARSDETVERARLWKDDKQLTRGGGMWGVEVQMPGEGNKTGNKKRGVLFRFRGRT